MRRWKIAAVGVLALMTTACTQQPPLSGTPTPSTTAVSAYSRAERAMIQSWPASDPDATLRAARIVCDRLAGVTDPTDVIAAVQQTDIGRGLSDDRAYEFADSAVTFLCQEHTNTVVAAKNSPVQIARGGVYLVGSDIEPGIWETDGAAPGRTGSCYWARLKGLSGEIRDIIANDNIDGRAVVEIRPSDVAFETTGCSTWRKRS